MPAAFFKHHRVLMGKQILTWLHEMKLCRVFVLLPACLPACMRDDGTRMIDDFFCCSCSDHYFSFSTCLFISSQLSQNEKQTRDSWDKNLRQLSNAFMVKNLKLFWRIVLEHFSWSKKSEQLTLKKISNLKKKVKFLRRASHLHPHTLNSSYIHKKILRDKVETR